MDRPSQTTGRTFLQQTDAAAGAPFLIRNLISAPPSSTPRLAGFGGGGMVCYTVGGIAGSLREARLRRRCDAARLEQADRSPTRRTIRTSYRRLLGSGGKPADSVGEGHSGSEF